MKTLFHAAVAVSFAFAVSSCQKERAESKSAEALKPVRVLNFVHSPLIKPGEVLTPIEIDSNTAIIKPDGDTLFPRWYYHGAAASSANGRTLGIQSISTDWGWATINSPLKSGSTSQLLTVNSSRLYRSAVFNIRSTSGTMYNLGTMNIATANDTRSAELQIPTTCGDSYYPEVTTYTSTDPNNSDQVMHTSVSPFYQYSFQQFAGQGTAYGADMKLAYLEGRKNPPFLLATIANRSSSSVNGISYLFYKGVDKNANPINGNTGVITLPMQSSSYAPRGVAAAVTTIDAIEGYDMVLATYTRLNSESAYSIKYLVGKNINKETGVPTWLQARTAPITVPGFGNDIVDIGITIADFDNNNTLDLMVMGFSNAAIFYRIGYNLNSATGVADFSSPIKELATPDGNVIGGGVDGNPNWSDEFVVGYYTNDGPTPLFHNLIFPWDITTQTFTFASYVYTRATVGVTGVGGGVAFEDVDNDFDLDILSMAYIGGDFRFVVDYKYNGPFYGSDRLTHGICGGRTN